MGMRANKTAIGAFVVGAVALIVLAVVALGSGWFFRERPTYVMFFDGSVDGLSVGGPVLFRGVRVGTVTDIRMQLNPKDLSVLIPVYAEIGYDRIQTMGTEALPKDLEIQEKIISEMIKRGLRARLEMQSVVTGILQVSLDFYPETPSRIVGINRELVEIPTIPTPLQILAKRVEQIPLEEILDRVNLAVDGIQKLVNSPAMQEMAGSIRHASNDVRTLIGRVDAQIDPLAESLSGSAARFEGLAGTLEREIGPLTTSLRNTSDQAGIMLQEARAAFTRVQDVTADDAPVFNRLNRTLEELELAARSLRTLSDTIEQDPRVLLFGKKRPERNRQ